MIIARQLLRFQTTAFPFISVTSNYHRTFATMTTDHGKWKFNHTMLRVKDPQKSVEYYKYLGLSQVNKISFPDNKFDLYFLGALHALFKHMVLADHFFLHPLQHTTVQNRRPLAPTGLIAKASWNSPITMAANLIPISRLPTATPNPAKASVTSVSAWITSKQPANGWRMQATHFRRSSRMEGCAVSPSPRTLMAIGWR